MLAVALSLWLLELVFPFATISVYLSQVDDMVQYVWDKRSRSQQALLYSSTTEDLSRGDIEDLLKALEFMPGHPTSEETKQVH